MKKILLATTAVVALSTVSAQAFAADKIKLELGGFMQQYVAIANNDEVAPANGGVARGVNLNQWSSSEVYFRGSTKLDNGLTVKTDIQMETNTRTVGARNFDVASLEVSSDAIGAVTIGSTTHAVDSFTTRAPNVGLDFGDMAANFNVNADSATTASAAASPTTGVQLDDLGNKGLKLKYVSPNFSGINVFADYAAGDTTGQLTQQTGTQNDIYSYGVAYSDEVAGMTVSADLSHANINPAFDQNHVGVNVGMAGFTVGAGYTVFKDATSIAGSLTDTKTNADGKGYEFGVAYQTGPYSVSALYAKVKNKGTVAATQDNIDTTWSVAGAYDLGAGVALTGTYYSQKFDKENTGTAPTTFATGKATTGKAFVAGLEVGF
ncbi:MAG: porin [Magnetovibrio sp.]|nr:porin [Magnetovibrio sp.]